MTTRRAACESGAALSAEIGLSVWTAAPVGRPFVFGARQNSAPTVRKYMRGAIG
ncbi:hypothetical protein C7453_11071 [Gluconacetobacter liquefaciens]|uniref:Uncharacterized protein n=1 Tax=Gluconacetobacter liquefaciens TaxID=89584 RepID=A0A370G1C1_GLULI|nr:hypothetical protein C7453_11071 [Gluconacetobacter liquefaciens]